MRVTNAGMDQPARPTTGTDERAALAELMQRYIAGDDGAYDQLYRSVLPRVRRELRKWIQDPRALDDVTQMVFLRVHLGRIAYRPGRRHADAALLAWFRTIARNTAHNFMRKAAGDRLRCGDEAGAALERACDETDDPEQVLLERARIGERNRRLRAAVGRLPPAQREVVRLQRFVGLPLTEVARKLGLPRGTVRVRAHRGCTTLRERATQLGLAMAV